MDDPVRARFLADVLARPDEDAPRLVFADWLTRQGDPRGEFIVTQIQLEHASGGERMRLVDQLYRRAGWLEPIMDVVPAIETKRGFLHAITTRARVFATRCGPWFAEEPIEELRVVRPTVADLRILRKARHLRKLRSLTFVDPVRIETVDDLAAVSELLAGLNVRALELKISVADVIAAQTRERFAHLELPSVETLKLHLSATQASAIASSLATARLPRLRYAAVPKYAIGAMRAAFYNADVTAT